jgi:hypothetical protein
MTSLRNIRRQNAGAYMGVVLSTAHYAKFLPTGSRVRPTSSCSTAFGRITCTLQKNSVCLGKLYFEGFNPIYWLKTSF